MAAISDNNRDNEIRQAFQEDRRTQQLVDQVIFLNPGESRRVSMAYRSPDQEVPIVFRNAYNEASPDGQFRMGFILTVDVTDRVARPVIYVVANQSFVELLDLPIMQQRQPLQVSLSRWHLQSSVMANRLEVRILLGPSERRMEFVDEDVALIRNQYEFTTASKHGSAPQNSVLYVWSGVRSEEMAVERVPEEEAPV